MKESLANLQIELAEVQQRIQQLEGCLHDRVVQLDSLDVNDDRPGQTAIHLATMGNHPACIHALVKVKCAVDQRNKDSLTPLMIASMNGHTEVVDALVAHGADETLSVDGEARGYRVVPGTRRCPTPVLTPSPALVLIPILISSPLALVQPIVFLRDARPLQDRIYAGYASPG